MSGEDEWISAAAALRLLDMPQGGIRTICKRAHVGLIKAKAARFIRNRQEADDVEVPREFWWAGGEAALTQNWRAGDFETFAQGRHGDVRLQAFGVTFLRSDIERARPAPSEVVEERRKTTAGTKVFIGHGHSKVWLELRGFLSDRLHLPTDEFNSVPTAGISTANRLEEMLDDAAFAFLVLTAEDEQSDGKRQARLNVVHEAGLFQGRLGFKKAIILLEEACEEFSNIHGLGQIRFPNGDIGAKFEEIRRVLERERLIAAS